MDDALAGERQKTSANLREDVDALRFWHFLPRTHHLREVPVAKFLDDIVVLGALHDVPKADDVFGVYALDDADLVFEGGTQVVVGIDWLKVELLMYLGMILTATGSLSSSLIPR